MAAGAKFAFLGRTFIYGVAAPDRSGADHTISMLKIQLHQLMQQIGCSTENDFPNHLIRRVQVITADNS